MCTLESLLIILSAKNAKDANCFQYIKAFLRSLRVSWIQERDQGGQCV